MSKMKVIQSSWMYATHRTMVIHSLAKQTMTMSKDKKADSWTHSHVINPLNLTLRSKVNVVSESLMYLTHPLMHMVIDPCAKCGMPMSKPTDVTERRWRHDMTEVYKFDHEVKGQHRISGTECTWQWQKSINLTMRSKVNLESGTWMYVSRNVKTPINLTLRSKFKVVSGSWMYATHRLMVIHLSLIHIWRCRRYAVCRSRWSPYH